MIDRMTPRRDRRPMTPATPVAITKSGQPRTRKPAKASMTGSLGNPIEPGRSESNSNTTNSRPNVTTHPMPKQRHVVAARARADCFELGGNVTSLPGASAAGWSGGTWGTDCSLIRKGTYPGHEAIDDSWRLAIRTQGTRRSGVCAGFAGVDGAGFPGVTGKGVFANTSITNSRARILFLAASLAASDVPSARSEGLTMSHRKNPLEVNIPAALLNRSAATSTPAFPASTPASLAASFADPGIGGNSPSVCRKA